MDMPELLRKFADAVVAEGKESEFFSVIRTAISGPDVAILLYTWGDPHEIFGRIYRYVDLYEIYSDETIEPEAYASDVVTHDFKPPPGEGAVLKYSWEDNLGVGREPIHWCDIANDFSKLNPVLHYIAPEWKS